MFEGGAAIRVLQTGTRPLSAADSSGGAVVGAAEVDGVAVSAEDGVGVTDSSPDCPPHPASNRTQSTIQGYSVRVFISFTIL